MKSIKAKIARPPLTPINGRKIIAIDPSTHDIAFSFMEGKGSKCVLKAAGKFSVPKNSNVSDRARVYNAALVELVGRYSPDTVVIEETVYLQNPNSSRQLAYIVGMLWGKSIDLGVRVYDVSPLVWKPYIGYKNVRKAEKDAWTAEMGLTESKKKAAFERKERVRQIMIQTFPGLDVSDTDVNDAIAIGFWAIHNT